jgi:hypothetical protein
MSGGGENKVGVGVGVAVGAARNEGKREEVEIREFVAFNVSKMRRNATISWRPISALLLLSATTKLFRKLFCDN